MLRTLLGQRAVDNRGVVRLLLTGMAVGFLGLIAAGIAVAWIAGRNNYHADWVTHTYQVQAEIAELQNALERSETAHRGFLLSAQPRFVDAYRRNAGELAPRLAHLRALTIDNGRQTRRFDQLRPELALLARLRARSFALAAGGQAEPLALFRTGQVADAIVRVRDSLRAATAEEQRLLAIRQGDLRGSVRTFVAILSLAGLLILAVALVSLLTILRYTRDLDASREQLQALNTGLEQAVDERTADLRLANEEIQRFAYIVSHDLRSPLVNVMGFTAELEAAAAALRELVERADEAAPAIVTEEARLAATEDLPEAIGFIRTSTAKMDRLINAILRLSREGRRVLTPERLDMGAVVATIAATLKHRTDDVGAIIEVEGALPALTSDRVAVEQVFSNVIENAVKYLDPKRAGQIVVSGHMAGKRAVFAVRDNGRGIAAHDHQRIFDLFRRSGQQDQPGEGIGLAHVRALTYRLGGSIEVESELGRGTTFRIALPLLLNDVQDRPT